MIFFTPAPPPPTSSFCDECDKAERERQEARRQRFRAMMAIGLTPSDPPLRSLIEEKKKGGGRE